jgi:hypothetical protein
MGVFARGTTSFRRSASDCFAPIALLTAVLTPVLAGCSGQQHPAAQAAPASSPADLTSPPTPVPVPAPSNPAGSPDTISGKYTLYKHPSACIGRQTCLTERMKVRIACTGGACTITRTNGNSVGLRPWTHPIPLTYDGQVWRAHGPEAGAYECNGSPEPATVEFALSVVSWHDMNGVPRAIQLMGSYTAVAGVTACNSRPVKGVFVVSSRNLQNWPGTAVLGKVEQLASLIWQVTDESSTLCEVLQCKLAKSNPVKAISAVSRIATIGSLVKALQQVIIWKEDTTALIAATNGHVKGTPFSPQAQTLMKKWYRDGYDLQQDIEDAAPGLSLVWHPLPPPK